MEAKIYDKDDVSDEAITSKLGQLETLLDRADGDVAKMTEALMRFDQAEVNCMLVKKIEAYDSLLVNSNELCARLNLVEKSIDMLHHATNPEYDESELEDILEDVEDVFPSDFECDCDGPTGPQAS